jgi:hypothetical protein
MLRLCGHMISHDVLQLPAKEQQLCARQTLKLPAAGQQVSSARDLPVTRCQAGVCSELPALPVAHSTNGSRDVSGGPDLPSLSGDFPSWVPVKARQGSPLPTSHKSRQRVELLPPASKSCNGDRQGVAWAHPPGARSTLRPSQGYCEASMPPFLSLDETSLLEMNPSSIEVPSFSRPRSWSQQPSSTPSLLMSSVRLRG